MMSIDDSLNRLDIDTVAAHVKQEKMQYYDDYSSSQNAHTSNPKSNRSIVFSTFNETSWVNLFTQDYKLMYDLAIFKTPLQKSFKLNPGIFALKDQNQILK